MRASSSANLAWLQRNISAVCCSMDAHEVQPGVRMHIVLLPSGVAPALQIVTERPTPVHTANVPDVWFPPSMRPIASSAPDNYVARYTAFVCRKRDVDVKLLICSDDEVAAHIDGKKVCVWQAYAPAERDTVSATTGLGCAAALPLQMLTRVYILSAVECACACRHRSGA
jgi:hypothetical protein